MEDNKYYTPTIEEFHVGFEFEMDDTWGGWVKLTLTKELLKNPLVSIGSGNDRMPYYYKTRVKYLDKEDIESLGFNYSATRNQFEKYVNEDFRYEIRLLSLTITISHCNLNQKIHIPYTIFQGTIKNKSELIVLLKQLGIIEQIGKGIIEQIEDSGMKPWPLDVEKIKSVLEDIEEGNKSSN
jgi:hypothetical protein